MSKMLTHLLELPEDTLLFILSQLDVPSIGSLSRVCKRLQRLCKNDLIWKRLGTDMINTAAASSELQRSGGLTYKQVCRTSRNWTEGRYSDITLIKFRENFLPWIQVEKEYVHLTLGSTLHSYKRKKGQGNARIHLRPACVYTGHLDDICRFVKRDRFVVTGGRDGVVNVYGTGSGQAVQSLIGHSSHVYAVDMDASNRVVVSGSRDQTVRVWSMDSGETKCLLPVEDTVFSIGASAWDSTLVTGSACYFRPTPLQVWDLNVGVVKYTLGGGYRKGAGVLDLQLESSSTLLSCGYDTYVRWWDFRQDSRSCALAFEEPDDSAIYCLKSDLNYTVVSGSSMYGVVRLWDKRRADICVQTFYTRHNRHYTNSPVYSLSFDTTHLYVALDRGVQLLDFKAPRE